MKTPQADPDTLADLLVDTKRNINLAAGATRDIFDTIKKFFQNYMDLDNKTSFMGVYILHKNMLVLGPYVGPPTVHSLIPISQGVVGKCAESGQTIIIRDVTSCDYYIACCEDVKSEIVVPIHKPSQAVAAVLDLDSDRAGAYDEKDIAILEDITVLLRQSCIHLESGLRLRIEW